VGLERDGVKVLDVKTEEKATSCTSQSRRR
jgi:hypothetical protein